jgi:hypothetical protein
MMADVSLTRPTIRTEQLLQLVAATQTREKPQGVS